MSKPIQSILKKTAGLAPVASSAAPRVFVKSMSALDSKPKVYPPVFQDEGMFSLPNDDLYDGVFEIRKKERTAKSLGQGTYYTWDGESYTGVWDNNKLSDDGPATITYADTSRYEGYLVGCKYEGAGVYRFPDNSFLMSEFKNNQPVGDIELLDPNGHRWHGKAEPGYVWLTATNHYLAALQRRTAGLDGTSSKHNVSTLDGEKFESKVSTNRTNSAQIEI